MVQTLRPPSSVMAERVESEQAPMGEGSPPGDAATPGTVVQCPHTRCGGCAGVGVAYGEQLARKHGRVARALGRHWELSADRPEPIVGAATTVQYRTRAKLMVAEDGSIGLYAKGGGHHAVDIPECQVLAPSIAAVVADLRARFARERPTGLTALDVRELRTDEGAPSTLLTLVFDRTSAPPSPPFKRSRANLLRDGPSIVGVAANFQVEGSPQVLGPETVPLGGVVSAPDRVGRSVHLATFGSFVQAHRAQAASVHDLVVGHLLPATGKVLDVYGGAGSIGLALAEAGASVLVVESFAPAAERARAQARQASLPLEAQCADATVALGELVRRGEAVSGVVVNPPRRGIDPPAREAIARLSPDKLAYVSCDPDTLARDLAHLRRLGYRAARIVPVDMIPLTEEVECVALLVKETPAPPLVLLDDDELLVVCKEAHEPAETGRNAVGSLTDRVRSLPGASRATPITPLEAYTSGVMVFVKDPALTSKWQSIFRANAAKQVYIALCRGITPVKGAIVRGALPHGNRGGRGAPPVRTRYRRLAVASGHSVLRVVADPGGGHRICRHLASVGHAVLGDGRFGHGPSNRHLLERHALDRPFLHRVRLEIEVPPRSPGEPVKRLVIEAPLPGDLKTVLERLASPRLLDLLESKNALGSVVSSPLAPHPSRAHDEDHAPPSQGAPASSPRNGPASDPCSSSAKSKSVA